MSAVSGLFTTAEKLRFDIEHNLVQLEDRATVVLQNMLQSDDNAQQRQSLELQSSMESSVAQKIDELGRLYHEADASIEREPASRREMWRERVRQLADRVAQFRQDMNKYRQRMERERSNQQRLSMLSNRSKPVRDNLVDLYGKEEASLQHSIRAVDDMEQIGGIVLRSLGKQKEHIKSASDRMASVLAVLGLSNTTIRSVTQRELGDRVIFWCGVGLTLTVLALLYVYYVR